MDLVEHARRELTRAGEFRDNPANAQSILAAVAAIESYDGHSGASLLATIGVLTELLQRRTLTPLTSDPNEWYPHPTGTSTMWQNIRDPAAFSDDGGATWYFVDGRKPSKTP